MIATVQFFGGHAEEGVSAWWDIQSQRKENKNMGKALAFIAVALIGFGVWATFQPAIGDSDVALCLILGVAAMLGAVWNT